MTPQRRSTDPPLRPQGWFERWGPRRARAALVVATVLYVATMVGAAVVLLRQGDAWERKLRVALIGLLVLIALWLWLRRLRVQWAQLRVETPASDAQDDDSGTWGVGGPGMREPGSTGLSRTLPRRRAQDLHSEFDDPDRLP